MSGYRSYLHVERLEHPDCEGLLQNDFVAVTAKVDGTNACVYWDADLNQVGGGSRKRALTEQKDNANFYAWIRSGQEEAVALRRFITDNPHLIVYGEWLGDSKFVGSIKTYDSSSLGHLYIFDVYNTYTHEYMWEYNWRSMLEVYGLSPWFVQLFGVLNHPSYDDIVEIAESNKFLLSNAENKGEGVVCKAKDWKNKYGHTCYGKIVLAEFHEHKKSGQKKANVQAENIEKDIVEYFVTESELIKAREKTSVYFGGEFRVEGKFMGYFLNQVWNDLIEETPYMLKKYQMPIINYRVLNAECKNRARRFLGLM